MIDTHRHKDRQDHVKGFKYKYMFNDCDVSLTVMYIVSSKHHSE